MHASFNSMWPSPNSNRRFLKFKVKRFEIGISDKHSISCSCKKLCTSFLLIPFVSTMASHWLQFRTKSCMSNAKIYGTPSDISIVRFLSTSLPTELMNMGHNIYRFLRLRVHHTAINVHSKFLFRMSWFGSNVWIVVDSRFVISKLQLGYLVIVFPYASEHLEQIIFFFHFEQNCQRNPVYRIGSHYKTVAFWLNHLRDKISTILSEKILFITF